VFELENSLTTSLITPAAQAWVPATTKAGLVNFALNITVATVGVTTSECAPQESTPLSVPTVAYILIAVSYTPIHITSVPKATAFLVVTLNVAV